MIAISADGIAGLQDVRKGHDFDYQLYSDASMTASRAFGIAYRLDDETVKKYRGFGIDVEQASGRTHHQLPVPSVFLVEKGGRIRWVYSNPNYKVRPKNAELLEAARKAAVER